MSTRRRFAGAAFVLALACAVFSSAAFPAAAAAEPAPPQSAAAPHANAAAPPSPPSAPEADPDSPRAALKQFLLLCNDGEYTEAADYLDLPDSLKSEGPALALRLKGVLDRQIWIKLEAISPKAAGSLEDGLPPSVEEIGTVPGRTGTEPVRLIRKNRPEGPRWLFSRATVERVNDWYSRLQDRWLRDYLPDPLLRPGPYDVMWWQWISLPVLIGLAYGLGKALDRITRRMLRRIFAGAHVAEPFPFLRLGGPLTMAWALLALYIVVPRIGLYPPAEAVFERVLSAGLIAVAFWFALRAVDVIRDRLVARPSTQENPAARSLVPLGAKSAKIIVVVMAAIAVFSQLGYAVGSLLAGLGIGGVALALAAQKTVENLFGSLSIGVDQPFRVGDYIQVDGIEGTVEAIGLRSTRIRTLDRTLVTIANGKLADMRIESYTARDRMRLHCTVGLVYETRAEQVREVVEGIRTYLEGNPKVFQDIIIVFFARMNDWSLDIEVMTWFKTSDWIQFRALRQEALLAFLEVVEQAGTSVAFPTRMLHIAPPRREELPFAEPPPPASPTSPTSPRGRPVRA